MGLFSFVTTAGEKLGGAVYDMLHKDEDIEQPTTITPERMNELRQKHIEKTLTGLEADVSAVQVAVNGDTAVLTGRVPDQETCEKVTLAAGNQQGIATVDCQLEVEKPEPESTLYTVKSGDTLGRIASEVYGDASRYPLIFEANRPLLTDPNKIYVGQVLRIPPASA